MTEQELESKIEELKREINKLESERLHLSISRRNPQIIEFTKNIFNKYPDKNILLIAGCCGSESGRYVCEIEDGYEELYDTINWNSKYNKIAKPIIPEEIGYTEFDKIYDLVKEDLPNFNDFCGEEINEFWYGYFVLTRDCKLIYTVIRGDGLPQNGNRLAYHYIANYLNENKNCGWN